MASYFFCIMFKWRKVLFAIGFRVLVLNYAYLHDTRCFELFKQRN